MAESICQNCFHSYVCEQFNEHRDSYNEKCRFYNDHFVSAADVVERKRGEWEDYHFIKADCPKDGFPSVKCSACGIVFCDLINVHRYMYHFCPNCGADMRGESE